MMRTALLAAALTALASPAWAEAGGWGEGIAVMEEAELAEQRGGFRIGEIDVSFGAVITTLVDGVPALTTQLTWTSVGAVIHETIGAPGPDISGLAPHQLALLGAGPSAHSGGVVIEDAAGVTEIVHNVTRGALQNIVINSASGRDIAQQIDVTLELPGFELVQASLITQRFGLHIADDLSGAMVLDPG
jgi:hypothetical protein